MSTGILQKLGPQDLVDPSSIVFKHLLEDPERNQDYEQAKEYFQKKDAREKQQNKDDFDALIFSAYIEHCDLSAQLKFQQKKIQETLALDAAQFQQKLQAQRDWEKVDASLMPQGISPVPDVIADLSKALTLDYKLKSLFDSAFVLRLTRQHWKKTQWKPAVKKAAGIAASAIATAVTEDIKNHPVYLALLEQLPELTRNAILKDMAAKQAEMAANITDNITRALGTEGTPADKARLVPELVNLAKEKNTTVEEVVEPADRMRRDAMVAVNLADYYRGIKQLLVAHKLDETHPEAYKQWAPYRLAARYVNDKKCKNVLDDFRDTLNSKYKSYPGDPLQVHALHDEAGTLKNDLIQMLAQLENTSQPSNKITNHRHPSVQAHEKDATEVLQRLGV